MQTITFYVKPRDAADIRSQKTLAEHGYALEIHDLAVETWTPALLRPYFGNKPVAEWFDPQSPRVLSGAVKPDAMHAQGALVAMSADHDLIRTPLVKLDGRCGAGLTDAEWPDFLAGKTAPAAHPGAMSEFWMHDD